MPYHTKRWVNGSITAAIWNVYNTISWNYTNDLTHQDIAYNFNKYWHQNKENREKIKDKNQYHGRSRWPSLIVIPDISNNHMILSEINKIGIPVIGLVNSHCTFEIDYPIFAQDQTISSVYFFCNFLSTLVAKEMAYSQHKHYVLQKIPSQGKKKNRTFQQIVKHLKWKKNVNKLTFFFTSILPAKIKARNQYFSNKLRVISSSWKNIIPPQKKKKDLIWKKKPATAYFSLYIKNKNKNRKPEKKKIHV